jgi:uncharacterized protein
MKCPVCKTPDLLMTERQSIEIDYCPECRGVWLDRGELDKLVAQVNEAMPARADDRPRDDAAQDSRQARPQYRNERHHDDRPRGDDYRYDNRHDSRYGHNGYRKKRSLFDMFDFD